jgi:hypothetical protein
MEWTKHFEDMLVERGILSEWVQFAIQQPDRQEEHADGMRHYLKNISERENRWLRVIINVSVQPHRAVTVFFDRRLRRISHENQNG